MQSGLIQVELQGYGALLSLERLPLDCAVSSRRVVLASYVNTGLGSLTQFLEALKWSPVSASLAALADRFQIAFEEIQTECTRVCRLLGIHSRMCFRKMGAVIRCLLTRAHRRNLSASAALVARENNPNFRERLIDRLADALRGMFIWFREICRAVESVGGLVEGPVRLGVAAARFVVQADTRQGVLVMRFDDGHQELFNLTKAQWQFVIPLLTSEHPLGHARLTGRPQGLLTRHDANGDEIAGDLHRLKQYIHPVGRGRGGTGFYFLAPYPRRLNQVD